MAPPGGRGAHQHRVNNQLNGSGPGASPQLIQRDSRSLDHRSLGLGLGTPPGRDSRSLDYRTPDQQRLLDERLKSESSDSIASLTGRVIDQADLVPYSTASTRGATRPYTMESNARDPRRSPSRDPSSPSRDPHSPSRDPHSPSRANGRASRGDSVSPPPPFGEAAPMTFLSRDFVALRHWTTTASSPVALPERCHHATLAEALTSLSGVIEDIQGQYPELQQLEEQVVFLQDFIKVRTQTGIRRYSSTRFLDLIQRIEFLSISVTIVHNIGA